MPLGLVGFDKRAIGKAPFLVGIDEAGRGCLAGPVVASAVWCESPFYGSSWCRRNSRGVDDSKRLTAEQRVAIVTRFRRACEERWIRVGIGMASVEEIEKHNIYHATTLAMRRALAEVTGEEAEGLFDPQALADPGRILIDGKPIRAFPCPHEGIVGGDQRSLAIALAGIHAKVWRDRHMCELHTGCPQYGFRSHKGYGTAGHVEALRSHGPSPHHRASFLRKYRELIEGKTAISQDSLF